VRGYAYFFDKSWPPFGTTKIGEGEGYYSHFTFSKSCHAWSSLPLFQALASEDLKLSDKLCSQYKVDLCSAFLGA